LPPRGDGGQRCSCQGGHGGEEGSVVEVVREEPTHR